MSTYSIMLYFLVKSEGLIWQPCMILVDVGVKSNARKVLWGLEKV